MKHKRFKETSKQMNGPGKAALKPRTVQGVYMVLYSPLDVYMVPYVPGFGYHPRRLYLLSQDVLLNLGSNLSL